jgi:hypothetical protein
MPVRAIAALTLATLAALTLATLAVLAPAADARLPPSGGKAIVVGSSIGGVKLGMDAAAAVKKWGKGGTCDAAIGLTCRWDGSMKQGSVRFEVTDGKVSTIVIEAGQRPTTYEPVYSGPITKWKTPKGIGIGSPLRRVAKKYPKAKPNGGGLELRSGKRTTFFGSSGGRAESISIVAG